MKDEDIVSFVESWIAKQRTVFKPEGYLFDKQLEFLKDPTRWKTACCGGRAGKTVAAAAYLIQVAQQKKRCVALYLTLSRANAKKLIWPELKLINSKFQLGGVVNEADLSINLDGSYIYASGASSRDEIEKFRGLPLALCIIDEAQSFPDYIRQLIDDVISKRLFDFNGVLALTGTPGPVPHGYFYDACHNASYKHFHWTMFNNPWIKEKSGKEPEALLQEELDRKGVTIDNPTIQREVFGQWTLDTSALVLNYEVSRNHYDELPKEAFSHIMGIDLGFKDADAIAILGHTARSPVTFLVDELITTKQGLTELFVQVEELRKKYNVYKMVIDTGGLGLKIAEEMRRRYLIPVQAAEKTRKLENIELFNDALRTAKFRAKKTSRFAADAMLLEWDVDQMRPDRKVISDRFHSDIIDAALYAFRESPAYTYRTEVKKPIYGSPEWAEQEAIDMERKAEEHFKEQAIGIEPEPTENIEWL